MGSILLYLDLLRLEATMVIPRSRQSIGDLVHYSGNIAFSRQALQAGR